MSEFVTPPAGYRLPADLRLGAVTLAVSDIERSLSFYRDLLGMHVLSHDVDRVEFGVPDTNEPLLVLRGGVETRTTHRGRLGLYHYAVLLPDRASLGRLLRRLLDEGVRPGAADHLVSEALYLQDPDDHGIELYRDRPRDEWTIRDGTLAMTSDPIDATGLLDAARGTAWDGMPGSTIIGHMHLHVADLTTARSFYHDALGLDIVTDAYPGALFMSAGGYHHHLGVNTWAGHNAVSPSEREPRLLSWDIVLPEQGDVDAAAASIMQHGFAVSPDGVVQDPWGTTFRLRPDI